MATKKDNKRFVVRRLRRALNLAEVPPTHISRKPIVSGWGSGSGLRAIDARDGSDDLYDYDGIFDDYDGCCERYPLHADEDEGYGWTLNAANDDDPPKLGDLIAV